MKNNKILRKSLAGYGIFLISSVVALLIVGNVLAGTYSNLISTIFQQSTTKKIEIDNKDEINMSELKDIFDIDKIEVE